MAHVHPEKVQIAQECEVAVRRSRCAGEPADEWIRTTIRVVYSASMTDEMIVARRKGRSPSVSRTCARWAWCRIMCVPMVAHDRVLGV